MTDVDVIDAEVIEEAPSTALVAFDARPVMTPDEAHRQVEYKREVLTAALREGTDYMKIPGTPKPSLLKPGAEALLQFFGFGHHFADPDYESDENGKRWGVTYRCIVTKPMGDRDVIVASCDGYASRDESKWKASPWNTILKMAQKRALVGAALTATGTSGLLTQDIEDYQDHGPDLGPIVAELKNRARALPPEGQEAMKRAFKSIGKKVEFADAHTLADLLVEIGRLSPATAASPDAAVSTGNQEEVGSLADSPSNTSAGEGGGDAPDTGALTVKQRSGIMAHLGGMTREARLARLSAILERPVASTNDLTAAEASTVLDVLGAGG